MAKYIGGSKPSTESLSESMDKRQGNGPFDWDQITKTDSNADRYYKGAFLKSSMFWYFTIITLIIVVAILFSVL